jgi:hypothetical protein
MDAVMPWAELHSLVVPHSSKSEMGRKPVGLDIIDPALKCCYAAA